MPEVISVTLEETEKRESRQQQIRKRKRKRYDGKQTQKTREKLYGVRRSSFNSYVRKARTSIKRIIEVCFKVELLLHLSVLCLNKERNLFLTLIYTLQSLVVKAQLVSKMSKSIRWTWYVVRIGYMIKWEILLKCENECEKHVCCLSHVIPYDLLVLVFIPLFGFVFSPAIASRLLSNSLYSVTKKALLHVRDVSHVKPLPKDYVTQTQCIFVTVCAIS
jgi:hypothetical protein